MRISRNINTERGKKRIPIKSLLSVTFLSYICIQIISSSHELISDLKSLCLLMKISMIFVKTRNETVKWFHSWNSKNSHFLLVFESLSHLSYLESDSSSRFWESREFKAKMQVLLFNHESFAFSPIHVFYSTVLWTIL